MAAGRMLRIRVDRPSTKDRIAERLEAMAEQRGTSLNSLILQAIREFVGRSEGKLPGPEELTELLRSTTRLLGTITDAQVVIRQRVDKLEKLADSFNRARYNHANHLETIGANLFKLLEEHNPNWTQEDRDSAWTKLASERNEPVPTGSLFA